MIWLRWRCRPKMRQVKFWLVFCAEQGCAERLSNGYETFGWYFDGAGDVWCSAHRPDARALP